ncbi:MAG: OmpP1/FadL family transporter [Magnetospiraceae bacterium]
MTMRISMLSSVFSMGVLALCAAPAGATTGYFSHGYGVIQKGMGGVGVAIVTDTQSSMRNPAAMVHVGNRVDVDLGWFSPRRDTTLSGFNLEFDSKKEDFIIPSMGANYMIDDVSSIGLTISANGGMNTHYSDLAITGFFGGPTPVGVDLAQGFIGVTYARKLNDRHSIGITPILALQRFKAYGISGFGGFSVDPANLTDNGYDLSVGYGARIGYMGKLTDKLTIGASYQTKMYMDEFEDYRGLFAENGDFDIPAAAQLGIAYDFGNGLTLGLDWEYIFYGDVAAINNPGSNAFVNGLGSNNGGGFGWEDIHVVRVGAQYEIDDQWTVRGGYSWNEQPFDASDPASLAFNILAPATTQHHLSIGFTYDISESASISGAYTRVFSDTVSGASIFGPTELRMDQHEAVVGFTYRW